MKVLVLGAGAREHALVRSLAQDPDVQGIFAVPGNPGMAGAAVCEPLAEGILDPAAVARRAVEHGVDLVVVGPEAPLVAGVADAVRKRGIACFGPSAAAAQLEGSKAFAKEIMASAGVPTALAHVCRTLEEVTDALDAFGAPYVVKDDGLAAGKGVVVTENRMQAVAHAAQCLNRIAEYPTAGQDGSRPPTVVVEEYLDGPEVSLFCVTDGSTVVPLAPAQDFKRVGEDDSGPNTGGMGAYSPLDWAPPGLVDEVVQRVAQPTVDQMRHRGTPFVGLLYVGLALTSRGTRVVEFNARFGDPETQVVLARLKTPLGGLLHAAASGTLDQIAPLRWSPDYAVTVVVAAKGYPEAPRKCVLIEMGSSQDDEAYTLHAGTKIGSNGMLVSAGGRVLSVVATGADLTQARERAYRAVDRITMQGSHYRRDIALAALQGVVRVPTVL
ncbi:MAG TPA: phosphoribosylamine--glycine ligase [Dermatophilaceae bacterium]|nr:phosphoribosylamine--glycine ligase [Dermatophilaceae bacterium]